MFATWWLEKHLLVQLDNASRHLRLLRELCHHDPQGLRYITYEPIAFDQ